jgi:bacillithiol biosynthesis cysteine-adding enzyme BshC
VSNEPLTISFDKLNNFSRTWQAIAEGRVPENLYARPPADVNACRAAMDEQLSRTRPWKALADLFEARGKSYGLPPSALERLDALAEGRAVMVVTGQQVGYLGGPLFTLFKAYHTTRLAAQLEDVLHLPVLPVFWLEGEDHDLEEIRNAHYLDKNGELQNLRFDPGEEKRGFMAGLYPVNASADSDALADALALPNEDGLTMLRDAYGSGTLSDAMGKLLARLLGSRGLLVIEGMEPELRRMAMPLWEKVLDEGPALGELLKARSEELKAEGWSTPMEPTPDSYFFYLAGEDHIRKSLSYDGKLRTPDGEAETLSKEEIAQRVHRGEFSPKAALRPLFQDFVLPTVAYVAGPGELDYHAQLAPIYKRLDVAAPSLFPRLSATIVDARMEKLVEKLNVPYERLLGEDKQALIKEVVREEDELHSGELFDLVRYTIEALYKQLGPTLAEIDPTLEGAAHGAAGRSLQPLNELRQKTERALKQKHAILLTKLGKALTALRPEGKLSERVLSTGYYLGRFGGEKLMEAMDSMSVESREHAVVTIND